jgi:hypothetical protein
VSIPSAKPLTIVIPSCATSLTILAPISLPYLVARLVPTTAKQSDFNKSILPLQYKIIGQPSVSFSSGGYLSLLIVTILMVMN